MIHCANNSKNKNLVKGETYFQLYYYLTNIISTSSKENNNHEKNNIIKFFIKDKNFNDKEKNSFVNIMYFITKKFHKKTILVESIFDIK